MNFAKILFVIAAFVFFFGCKSKKNLSETYKVEVRYIDQICCGNMMTTDNYLAPSPCELYKDSLLRAINIEAFDIPQYSQFGDTLSIEYKLTMQCEASCEITCNRYNGIPIELIKVE